MAALAAEYAAVTIAGALPKILIYVPFWFLRLDGRSGQVTMMMLVMGVGNVILDVVFLYALDLRVRGAALASVLSTAAAAGLGFVRLCDGKSGFHFGILACPKGISFWEVAKAGSPSAANNLFQTLRVSVVNGLLLVFGGSEMVAAFTAVNCIAAFEESITGGVPQAASAMLGIYSGEYDNESARLLMVQQVRSGIPYSVLFAAVVIAAADLIGSAYGLAPSLRPAFVCTSLGIVPALVNCVLAGYYNMVDERHLAIVMADVSGKGVPAALFMVIGKTLIKDHTQPDKDLGEVFTEVNELLCASNSEGLFITAFEGVLDLTSGAFCFVNAGHEWPFICKKDGRFAPYQISADFVLAGLEGRQYKGGRMQLEVGDKIFQYTDGVTEAVDETEELYGMERLEKVLGESSELPPVGVLTRVKEDIEGFVGDAPQFDDITMLCLEYTARMEE